MATVIGDFAAEPSRYHNMIATTTPGLQHHAHESSPFRSGTRPRESPARRSSASPRNPRPRAASARSQHASSDWDHQQAASTPRDEARATQSTTGGASRFPSPPSSSSPGASSGPPHPENGSSSPPAYMETDPPAPSTGTVPKPRPQQPSPPSESFPLPEPADPYHAAGTSSPRSSQGQTTIRVRDLAHIQSLARADMVTGNGPGILNDPPLQQMKYEISGMPIGDIIEMVAALLTKITTTNDLQHDAMQRNVAHQQQATQASQNSDAAAQMSPLSTSVLAFHGKNVPAITILSYLSRIHKYCPTTYEVFLSLLVYFDRMTERVNDMVVKNEQAKQLAALQPPLAQDAVMKDEVDESDETDSDLADDEEMADDNAREEQSTDSAAGGTVVTGVSAPTAASGPATYFVVDSFNIHRLIIAGVTCASKFFSDVFYTNSRYAKVGGLPLPELNHLELQFLLLNDFRLHVPVEDLEAYATMLVEFYAREVVAQRSRPVVGRD